MKKMWAGRTEARVDKIADSFNSSISFDSRMYEEDITGSIVHAKMLEKQGIISFEERLSIENGLKTILSDLQTGKLEISSSAEDIHMFVEEVLTERIGDAGKKLHTARSRNDQVALDVRLYTRKTAKEVIGKLKALIGVIKNRAEENLDAIMPGYTHLQHAQPILFSHHILAYAFMFLRDIGRLEDCIKRINISPIGSCALAGTTYDTDRFFEAQNLGFSEPCRNSMDGVSDRDFCVEFLSAASLIMPHLSRFSEELILWSSWEFAFIEMSDAYSTGSSIMPQKKNSDMAELCRGKTGRVYGSLVSLLTTLKGLPLAYNKDMQEDKEALFDASDTVKVSLEVFTGMFESLAVHKEAMMNAARKGFMNATDLADYLVGRGMAFRDAYKISGRIVSYCIVQGKILENLSLEEYKNFSVLFDESVYGAIDIKTCVERRTSYGGTSESSVREQIVYLEKVLKES